MLNLCSHIWPSALNMHETKLTVKCSAVVTTFIGVDTTAEFPSSLGTTGTEWTDAWFVHTVNKVSYIFRFAGFPSRSNTQTVWLSLTDAVRHLVLTLDLKAVIFFRKKGEILPEWGCNISRRKVQLFREWRCSILRKKVKRSENKVLM